MSVRLQAFTMAVDAAVLTDLQRRLAGTRRPAAAPANAGYLGVSPVLLDAVLAHWQHTYDWRQWEAECNRSRQFMATIALEPELAADIHVLVETGSGSQPRPLLLTHGWPGSLAEMLPLVMPLAHPEQFGGRIEDAFTVVVPSLPGTGFSPAPRQLLSPRDIAALWHHLMRDGLGFKRFIAHGGDLGAAVSSWLALDYPDSLQGLHLNNSVMMPTWTFAGAALDPEEEAFLARFQARLAGETAYQMVHATRPQTLAHSLVDSPAGLAAWILEKMHSWSVASPNQPLLLDRDHLVTNLMFYWLGDAGASTWIYRYLLDMSGFTLPVDQRINTPTAFCLFPEDVAVPPPDQWLARGYNVSRCRRAPVGGHFPALQTPQLLLDDIREFAQTLPP